VLLLVWALQRSARHRQGKRLPGETTWLQSVATIIMLLQFVLAVH
jgi:hypothetical protein